MRAMDPEGDRRRSSLLAALVAAGGYFYLRRSLPQIDGDRDGRRPVGADRDHSRRRRHPAHLRRQQARCACSASATCTRRIGCGRWNSSAASATAACRKCSAPRRCRRIGFSAPSASAAPRARRGTSTPDWAKQQVERLRRRRQRVHRHASRRRAAAGVHAAPLRAGAVDRRRRPGLGEDDGLGSQRQLLVRAAAPRSARRGRRRTDGAADAAVPGGRPEHPARGRAGPADRAGPVARRETPWRDRLPADDRTAAERRRARSCRRSPPAIPPSAISCSAARGPKALGSNNWVVDGTLTASGKPLLANDPHLGTRLPSTWYLAHISAGDFDVIGGTLPGTPAVALGRNRFIAWGATNVAADVAGSVSRAARRRRHARRVPRRAGADHDHPGNDRVKGAAPVHAQRARHAPRSAGLRRDQRQQRRRRTRRRSRRRSSRSPSAGPRSMPTTARSPRF